MLYLFSAAAQRWVTNNTKPLLSLLKPTPDEKEKKLGVSEESSAHAVSRGTAAIHPTALWDVGPHAAFIKDHTLTAAQQTSTSAERRGPTCIKVGAQKRPKEKKKKTCPEFLGML